MMPAFEKPIFVDPLDLSDFTVSNAEAGYSASSLNRLDTMVLTWRTTGCYSARHLGWPPGRARRPTPTVVAPAYRRLGFAP